MSGISKKFIDLLFKLASIQFTTHETLGQIYFFLKPFVCKSSTLCAKGFEQFTEHEFGRIDEPQCIQRQ